MRLLAPTLLLPFLSFPFASASALHFTSTHPTPSRTIAARQHHQPRALLDVCVNLDTDLVTKDPLGIPLDLGVHLDVCLCLSALPLYIETNLNLGVALDLLGKNALTALLTALINNAPGSQQCHYPPHSKAVCSSSDPCDFTCSPPYVRSGKDCVCAKPNVECNGQCGSFPKGCSSAVPRALVARDGNAIKTTTGITTRADAQATCKKGETMCSLPDSSSNGFECLNVDATLESCGGCMYGHPFRNRYELALPKGVDCSSIKGALDVNCVAGRCDVKRCDAGYKVSPLRDMCVPSDNTALRLNSQAKRTRHVKRVLSNSNRGLLGTSLNTSSGDLLSDTSKLTNTTLNTADDHKIIRVTEGLVTDLLGAKQNRSDLMSDTAKVTNSTLDLADDHGVILGTEDLLKDILIREEDQSSGDLLRDTSKLTNATLKIADYHKIIKGTEGLVTDLVGAKQGGSDLSSDTAKVTNDTLDLADDHGVIQDTEGLVKDFRRREPPAPSATYRLPSTPTSHNGPHRSGGLPGTTIDLGLGLGLDLELKRDEPRQDEVSPFWRNAVRGSSRRYEQQ